MQRKLIAIVVLAGALLALVGVGLRWIAPEEHVETSTLLAAGTVLLVAHVLFWSGVAALCGGSRRRIAGRLALATAALALVLGLLELPAALQWFDWRVAFMRPDEDFLGRMKPWLNPWNRHDPELLYARPPNSRIKGSTPGDLVEWLGIATTRTYAYDLAYDRRGYRNPRDLATAPVAVVGDSFVECALVQQEQTLPARLAAEFGVDVANLGVGGYGPQQELIVLRRDALALHPKLVFWAFFEGNDLIDERRFGVDAKDASTVQVAKSGFPQRSFTKSALTFVTQLCTPRRTRDSEQARKLIGTLRVPGQSHGATLYFSFPAHPLTADDQKSFAHVTRLLEQAHAACAQAGAEFVVVFVPDKFRVYRELCDVPPDATTRGWTPNDLPDRFAAWAASTTTRFVDLTPTLTAAAGNGALLYFIDDGHWNADGQAVAAAELARQTRALLGAGGK